MRFFRRNRWPEIEPYEDDFEPGWPSHRAPEPPTERDGFRVGDRVTLVAHHGSRWPVEIVGFTILRDDLVVRWLGLQPMTQGRESTVSRAHLKAVLPAA